MPAALNQVFFLGSSRK